jgi:protein O-GlcNAc transferase
VPVVALRGRGFAGRHSATHLSNAGLGDWVTEDLDRYVALAIERASEPSRLETLRKRLPAELSSTPLGDADRFARHFAEAIRLMVAQWRDGAAPQAIAVPRLV